MAGFDALADASMRDGALDKITKELIALALGVAGHCDACIGFHVEGARQAGRDAPRESKKRSAWRVYMGGGPSLMYAADALSAFEQLDKDTECRA